MYYLNPEVEKLNRIFDQNMREPYLRLDLNENPGGLPEEFVRKVLSEITPQFVAQYPETLPFTTELAGYLHTGIENICLVNGSSEGIRNIIYAFSSPGGRIVGVTPTYAMFEVYSKMYGRNFAPVRYNEDLTIDVENVLEAMTPETQIAIVCNPNNPMGNAFSTEEMERIYQKAAEMLNSDIAEGKYVRDSVPKYYIYELTMDGRSQTGIVACAAVDDYLSGTIKRHENTLAAKEQDRIRHIDTLSAQTGPIFLAYRADQTINEAVARVKQQAPLYDFISDDGIGHRVFEIAEAEDIETVRNAFAGINSIYIADGHHRAASAVKVALKRREENPDYTGQEEFNYFLSVLFPESAVRQFLAVGRPAMEKARAVGCHQPRLTAERNDIHPRAEPFVKSHMADRDGVL